MNNQEFLFLFDAILRNITEHRESRQAVLLLRALSNGHICLATATALRGKHFIKWCTLEDLSRASITYHATLPPDPDGQLDRQQMAGLEPPGEFEQDPANPCGATDPRF